MRSSYTMPCACFRPGARRQASTSLDTVGWAIFLVWVGASFLFDVGWGIGLLGVGILALSMQFVRRRFGLRVERCPLLVGGAFAVAGIWESAGIEVSPVPIALMVLGLIILISALRRSDT